MERKLFRLEGSPAMLGGVAAGLASYFNIDIAIVRVVFILGFFTPIPVGIAYLILWFALPKQYAFATDITSNSNLNTNPIFDMSTNKTHGSQLAGIILVILGGIFLADEFLPWFDFDKLWPLGLIAAGIWIFMKPKTEINQVVNEEAISNNANVKSDTVEDVDTTINNILNK